MVTWNLKQSWRPSIQDSGTPGLSSTRGDFNGDGLVDTEDIDLLFSEVEQDTHQSGFNLTRDVLVDLADVSELVEGVLNTRNGDTNLDGTVGFDDFVRLTNSVGDGTAGWSSGDFTGDGKTDFEDFQLLAAEFGFKRTT